LYQNWLEKEKKEWIVVWMSPSYCFKFNYQTMAWRKIGTENYKKFMDSHFRWLCVLS